MQKEPLMNGHVGTDFRAANEIELNVCSVDRLGGELAWVERHREDKTSTAPVPWLKARVTARP